MTPRVPNTITLKDGRRVVCRIWDYGEETFDRYTVALKGYNAGCGYGMVYPYLAASPRPFHPQGLGLHGESREFLKGQHLGKRIKFDSCPPDVQKFILMQFKKEAT